MITGLVAEIGNNHFGSLEKAKEMIKVALDSGADLVKLQAIDGDEIMGSMPRNFYKKCEFSTEQYIELIYYGLDIGMDVFYSIISDKHNAIMMHEFYHKVSARQWDNLCEDSACLDSGDVIISISASGSLVPMNRATMMYASDYLTDDPQLERIRHLNEFYGRPCGYSDHTIGIKYPKRAISEFRVPILEKHFTLEKDLKWSGVTFRDTVHGADPKELAKLAKEMSR